MISRKGNKIICDKCGAEVFDTEGSSVATHQDNFPDWHIGLREQFCPQCKSKYEMLLKKHQIEIEEFCARGEE